MIFKRLFITLIFCVLTIIALNFLWTNALSLDDMHCGKVNIHTDKKISENNSENINDPENSLQNKEEDGSLNENITSIKKGYHIHINLDKHILYVFNNGEFLKTYPVSGGKPSTPSPAGTWRVISKDTWGEGFGGAWLGFNVPWGEYGIHGTDEPWVVGKSNSSKGCIRMRNADVKELYKMIPHGTIVTIVHDNYVFRSMKNGDVGSDILEMQKYLKELGYYNGSPDGIFGNGLMAGVKKIQKASNLHVTGVINKQTYQLIIEHFQ
jgi:hypothetical protein